MRFQFYVVPDEARLDCWDSAEFDFTSGTRTESVTVQAGPTGGRGLQGQDTLKQQNLTEAIFPKRRRGNLCSISDALALSRVGKYGHHRLDDQQAMHYYVRQTINLLNLNYHYNFSHGYVVKIIITILLILMRSYYQK